MTFEEVMLALEEMGNEQTKNTFINHGAHEPLFGVRVGDLKKILKKIKLDHDLALRLFDTGNYDAMYLAGLAVDPEKMTENQLEQWAEAASWYMLAEYTVAWVTAESPYALKLARKWMQFDIEMIACAG